MSSEKISISQNQRPIIVNGYAMPDITREQLARWADNLTYVSYYSYGYNMNGDLVPLHDEELIRIAYDSGVAPLMVLTPFDENGAYSYDLVRLLFTNPVIRDRLINNIILTVMEKGYYGIVFNFGHIAAEDSEQFVITVSKTSARLNRKGYLVIVSLTPGVNDAGFNYESLARAANFIELRTFYWEQAYGPPSAVSHIDRIREMLGMMITVTEPRNLLLGLANYGFDWKLPLVSGVGAEMITHAEAEELAERTGAVVQYDEAAEAPHFSYRNAAGSQHEVWYEDDRSVRVKLELVNDFNLAGVSIWTIMSPFPAGVEAINELFTVIKV